MQQGIFGPLAGKQWGVPQASQLPSMNRDSTLLVNQLQTIRHEIPLPIRSGTSTIDELSVPGYSKLWDVYRVELLRLMD
jgi:hypothetical protein